MIPINVPVPSTSLLPLHSWYLHTGLIVILFLFHAYSRRRSAWDGKERRRAKTGSSFERRSLDELTHARLPPQPHRCHTTLKHARIHPPTPGLHRSPLPPVLRRAPRRSEGEAGPLHCPSHRPAHRYPPAAAYRQPAGGFVLVLFREPTEVRQRSSVLPTWLCPELWRKTDKGGGGSAAYARERFPAASDSARRPVGKLHTLRHGHPGR